MTSVTARRLPEVAGGSAPDAAGLLSTIGATPLVPLSNLLPNAPFELFAKLECFNPGGSIKDRSALSMISAAIADGSVIPGKTTIVESSSGNLAIGLAQVCRCLGLDLICVVDAKTSPHTLDILRAFRVRVEQIVDPDPVTGEYLSRRVDKVQELLASISNSYNPNQYANLMNPRAHEFTMAEIDRALGGRVDYVFASVSSFGTLRGCATYLRGALRPTALIAADALGSTIFPGQAPHRRLIPGHGASIRPALFQDNIARDVVHVSDQECAAGCRALVRREGILAGGSSGAAVMAMCRYAGQIPPGSRCVVILPDSGDRYLKTIYHDDWIERHLDITADRAVELWDSRLGDIA